MAETTWIDDLNKYLGVADTVLDTAQRGLETFNPYGGWPDYEPPQETIPKQAETKTATVEGTAAEGTAVKTFPWLIVGGIVAAYVLLR